MTSASSRNRVNDTADRLTDWLLMMPRSAKRLLALSVDGFLCALSVCLALYLRLGGWPDIFGYAWYPIVVAIVLALPLFVVFGLYRAIFRYAGSEALIEIARAVVIFAIPYSLIFTFSGVINVPRTVGLIQPILLLFMVAGSRIAARALFQMNYTALWQGDAKPRVLIYGAGRAGIELASGIVATREMRLVGFVDDNPVLWGSTLRGVPILSPGSLARQVPRLQVSDILLAIPSATRTRRGEILHDLREIGVHVRMLPSLIDLARGHLSVSDLKEPDIEDLLGRTVVPPNKALLRSNIAGRVVMVTGAGGSIGSELCRQIQRLEPETVLLVDHSEFNLYAIEQELAQAVPPGEGPQLVAILASVTDERRMDEIFRSWRPATVIHAAAYKHVPLVERNVIEGVRNNAYGTLCTAKLAQRHGTGNFVLVSTDKAVRPTNVMGATKRLAEMVLQALQRGGGTTFAMVRFGNVLGSSGSVVPLFRRQIVAGGPVTITDEEITRYFMTIPEAAQLVLQAGAMAAGGDVFLLDMGEPVKIRDLARNMIELSGLKVRDAATPDGDIEIHVTGLRPGEKLYEELLIGEASEASSHPRIFRAREHFLPWQELDDLLGQMGRAIANGDPRAARDILRRIVPEFQPNSDLVDWTSGPSLGDVA